MLRVCVVWLSVWLVVAECNDEDGGGDCDGKFGANEITAGVVVRERSSSSASACHIMLLFVVYMSVDVSMAI